MRVVLDTSTLIAAFLKPSGVRGQVLNAAEHQQYQLCLSLEILSETAAVLLRPKLIASYGRPKEAVREFCTGLAQVSTLMRDVPEITVIAQDPKDNPILSTALAAQADFLVSGDYAHILPLKEWEGTTIVDARQFLDILQHKRLS